MLDEMDAMRPRLRGVLHQYAFFVSLVFGGALVVAASGASERVSASVFAAALATMFGVSALYHRITWRPGPRRWMRRLDHAAIYLLIGGLVLWGINYLVTRSTGTVVAEEDLTTSPEDDRSHDDRT